MSFLEAKKVQARVLIRDTSYKDGKVKAENHAVITVDFVFLELELNQEGRYINPLGFQVLSYSNDEDVSWQSPE